MPAASKFFSSLTKVRYLTAKDILLGSFDKVKSALKRYKTHEFAALNYSLYRLIESEAYEKSQIKTIAKNLSAYFSTATAPFSASATIS